MLDLLDITQVNPRFHFHFTRPEGQPTVPKPNTTTTGGGAILLPTYEPPPCSSPWPRPRSRCAFPALRRQPDVSTSDDGGTFSTPLPASVQEDIGDIRPASKAPLASYFHGQAQVTGEYIANAHLFHGPHSPDFLINPNLRGGFTAPIGQRLFLDLDAEFDDVTYAGHDDLGFYGISGNADLQYRFKPTWPKLYAGVEPYYYNSYDTGHRLSSAFGPAAGIEQTVSINRGKTLFLFGYHFGDYYSSPSIDTRQSHTATVAVTQQLRRALYAQLYYQWEYSIYSQSDRDDSRNLVGLNMIYQFDPHLFASLFVNFVDNDSSSSLAKYENVNAGVTLTWQY